MKKEFFELGMCSFYRLCGELIIDSHYESLEDMCQVHNRGSDLKTILENVDKKEHSFSLEEFKEYVSQKGFIHCFTKIPRTKIYLDLLKEHIGTLQKLDVGVLGYGNQSLIITYMIRSFINEFNKRVEFKFGYDIVLKKQMLDAVVNGRSVVIGKDNLLGLCYLTHYLCQVRPPRGFKFKFGDLVAKIYEHGTLEVTIGDFCETYDFPYDDHANGPLLPIILQHVTENYDGYDCDNFFKVF